MSKYLIVALYIVLAYTQAETIKMFYVALGFLLAILLALLFFEPLQRPVMETMKLLDEYIAQVNEEFIRQVQFYKRQLDGESIPS